MEVTYHEPNTLRVQLDEHDQPNVGRILFSLRLLADTNQTPWLGVDACGVRVSPHVTKAYAEQFIAERVAEAADANARSFVEPSTVSVPPNDYL